MTVVVSSRSWLFVSLWLAPVLFALGLGSVALAQGTDSQRILLPVVLANPLVGELAFASRLNPDRTPQDPGTSFAYGITDLFISVPVYSSQGQTWRTEWYVDGAYLSQLDGSGSITTTPAQVADGICGIGPNGQCGAPVPRGRYEVRFYVGGELKASGSAEVR